MEIVELRAGDRRLRAEAAELLFDAFAENWPDAWPTMDAALEEVEESLAPDRLSLVALAEDERITGWIGAIPEYGGHVWELHPLAVRRELRGRGIGRGLVERLEHEVASRGALTLWVGTDDEAAMTSLGGVDLYPNVLEKLASIRDLRGHPFGFYLRLGFEVVGVVPDANGFGRPDILMAKRVAAHAVS